MIIGPDGPAGGLGHARKTMLWLIVVILILLWLGGFSLGVGGGLIHLLLVVVIIAVIYSLFTGRRIG